MAQTLFPSHLYHEAFQNTLKKAKQFIDKQVHDWASRAQPGAAPAHLRCGSVRVSRQQQHQQQQDPHRQATSGFSTSTLDLPLSSTTTSQLDYDDDEIHSMCSSQLDTPNPLCKPPAFFVDDAMHLAPPDYAAVMIHASPSANSSAATSSASLYHTIHHPSMPITRPPCRSLFDQHKPRPMSMPILFPELQQSSSNATMAAAATSPEPLDELFSPSAIQKWQHRRSCVIAPREEEGREALPPYKCTVYKMGKVNVKMETDANGNKIAKRSWRRLYIELWGTVLRIYPLSFFRASVGKEPLDIISLAGAEASRALDYTKKPFVLRLTASTGIQLLIQLPNHVSMVSWVEHLQAGINISLDLEYRPMPKFVTLPARRGCERGILTNRLIESEQRRENRRRNQQEILV
ncbi:hypothetical protein BC940DRAFT_296271 [Gongronella butleri]|nr:hypothetical protein BC940DRAFT_296271 [Gongronella butleri]